LPINGEGVVRKIKPKKKPKRPKRWTYSQTELESEIGFEPQDFVYARMLARKYSILIPRLLDAE
jgi:hypothetical protein